MMRSIGCVVAESPVGLLQREVVEEENEVPRTYPVQLRHGGDGDVAEVRFVSESDPGSATGSGFLVAFPIEPGLLGNREMGPVKCSNILDGTQMGE